MHGAVFGFFGEVDLLDQLLGQSGAALYAATSQSHDCSTQQTLWINTDMVVEVAVLNRDGRLAHVGGDFVAIYRNAVI